VQGGTPLHDGESLCDTCRCSRIVRGRTLDEEVDGSPDVRRPGARL